MIIMSLETPVYHGSFGLSSVFAADVPPCSPDGRRRTDAKGSIQKDYWPPMNADERRSKRANKKPRTAENPRRARGLLGIQTRLHAREPVHRSSGLVTERNLNSKSVND